MCIFLVFSGFSIFLCQYQSIVTCFGTFHRNVYHPGINVTIIGVFNRRVFQDNLRRNPAVQIQDFILANKGSQCIDFQWTQQIVHPCPTIIEQV